MSIALTNPYIGELLIAEGDLVDKLIQDHSSIDELAEEIRSTAAHYGSVLSEAEVAFKVISVFRNTMSAIGKEAFLRFCANRVGNGLERVGDMNIIIEHVETYFVSISQQARFYDEWNALLTERVVELFRLNVLGNLTWTEK